jgi:hypothetical protein
MIVRFRCGKHSVVWALALGEPICTIVTGDSRRAESWCDVAREDVAELVAKLTLLLAQAERENPRAG